MCILPIDRSIYLSISIYIYIDCTNCLLNIGMLLSKFRATCDALRQALSTNKDAGGTVHQVNHFLADLDAIQDTDRCMSIYIYRYIYRFIDTDVSFYLYLYIRI
jgi:hypothetical protein